MPGEISLELGNTVIFEVEVFDPITGNQVPADTPPTLEIKDPAGTTVFGPTAGTLVVGTSGTYRNQVFLSDVWTQGEFLGLYKWLVDGNDFKPRFTFHGHIKELP